MFNLSDKYKILLEMGIKNYNLECKYENREFTNNFVSLYDTYFQCIKKSMNKFDNKKITMENKFFILKVVSEGYFVLIPVFKVEYNMLIRILVEYEMNYKEGNNHIIYFNMKRGYRTNITVPIFSLDMESIEPDIHNYYLLYDFKKKLGEQTNIFKEKLEFNYNKIITDSNRRLEKYFDSHR